MRFPAHIAGLLPHGTLRREIAGVLLLKLCLLFLLYWAFFGPSHRPHLTAPDIASRVLGDAARE